MNARMLHPSIERTTVRHIDGGWISYVDPSLYPKARFSETKPYYAPECLSDLRGPDSGIIKLPHSICWGLNRWFNLSRRSSLHQVYQTVLQEGKIEDIIQYLDHTILLSIWSELILPPRVTHLWEQKVKGLNYV